MKILHIGNTAGVATQLRNAQRRLGHKSDILRFSRGAKNYDSDYYFTGYYSKNIPSVFGKGIRLIENISYLCQLIDDYDVLHFHFYTVIGGNVAPRKLPQGLDLLLWKINNKKIIKHHHGSDIRHRGVPYLQKKFADMRLVSTPDLLDWDPGAELVLNPIVTDNYEYVGVEEVPNSEPITLVHAPTDRKKKGTASVIDAIEDLQKEGLNIKLRIVENTPNEEAIEIYKQADIIADRFKLGWYGVFSIEAMCLGKPVLVYMKDEYKKYAPDAPVVDTPINKLKKNIKLLAQDFGLRNKLAQEGRKFVEKRHDAEEVGKKLIRIYENC